MTSSSKPACAGVGGAHTRKNPPQPGDLAGAGRSFLAERDSWYTLATLTLGQGTNVPVDSEFGPLKWSCAKMYTSQHTQDLHMSTTMTVRLEDDVKNRLDRLAGSTQRSKSFLAAEAIRVFVENNEWQIAQIDAALVEAEAGDFASDADVEALASKWKVNAA